MKRVSMTFLAASLLLAARESPAQSAGALANLDSDGDGRVSAEEFAARPGRFPRFFDEVDGDGNDALTRDELQAAIDAAASARERAGTQMLQRFGTIDADGDGSITRTEAAAHAFARVDADGDGFISDEEARAVHGQRRGWRSRREARD